MDSRVHVEELIKTQPEVLEPTQIDSSMVLNNEGGDVESMPGIIAENIKSINGSIGAVPELRSQGSGPVRSMGSGPAGSGHGAVMAAPNP